KMSLLQLRQLLLLPTPSKAISMKTKVAEKLSAYQPLHDAGSNVESNVVLFSPTVCMPLGASSSPQSQDTGLAGLPATTMGLMVSTFPSISLLTLLPMVIWTAPSSTLTDFTKLPMI